MNSPIPNWPTWPMCSSCDGAPCFVEHTPRGFVWASCPLCSRSWIVAWFMSFTFSKTRAPGQGYGELA